MLQLEHLEHLTPYLRFPVCQDETSDDILHKWLLFGRRIVVSESEIH